MSSFRERFGDLTVAQALEMNEKQSKIEEEEQDGKKENR